MRPLSIIFLTVVLAQVSCTVAPPPKASQPKTFLWAWERNEDLRFAKPNDLGVAFLAETLTLEGGGVIRSPRRQPLSVAPGAYVIAVTRIETSRDPTHRAELSDGQLRDVVKWIRQTADLPNVRGIQVDFDALNTERDFYRGLLLALRPAIPAEKSLSITALASWCMGDRWLGDLPIDEAVPMLFDMGTGEAAILRFLNAGTDWPEPLCRDSYGLSVEAPIIAGLKTNRHIYLFKSARWSENDLPNIKKFDTN